MRMYRIRWDLYVCLIIAVFIVLGLYKIGGPVFNKALDQCFSKKSNEQQIEDVFQSGSIGAKATEDITRVSTLNDLMEANGLVTMEMKSTSYFNFGTLEGDKYVWRILELGDENKIFALVNENNIIKVDNDIDTYIMPIGKLVKAPVEAEVLSRLKEYNMEVKTDYYLDMGAEACIISSATKNLKNILPLLSIVLPIILLAVFMLIIFALHALGTKIGIFPPLFIKKSKDNEI